MTTIPQLHAPYWYFCRCMYRVMEWKTYTTGQSNSNSRDPEMISSLEFTRINLCTSILSVILSMVYGSNTVLAKEKNCACGKVVVQLIEVNVGV